MELDEQNVNENRIDLAVLERMLTRNPVAEDQTSQDRTAEDDGATRISDGVAAVAKSSPVTEAAPRPEPEEKAESEPQMKAKIVDIPFARWDPPPDPPTGCKHEKSDGRRCGKTVWQNGMCGVHGEWHNTMAAALGLPFPDDQLSFHRFLLRTLDMVVSGRLQARQALAVEGICKMIFKNIRTGGFEM